MVTVCCVYICVCVCVCVFACLPVCGGHGVLHMCMCVRACDCIERSGIKLPVTFGNGTRSVCQTTVPPPLPPPPPPPPHPTPTGRQAASEDACSRGTPAAQKGLDAQRTRNYDQLRVSSTDVEFLPAKSTQPLRVSVITDKS